MIFLEENHAAQNLRSFLPHVVFPSLSLGQEKVTNVQGQIQLSSTGTGFKIELVGGGIRPIEGRLELPSLTQAAATEAVGRERVAWILGGSVVLAALLISVGLLALARSLGRRPGG